MHPAKHCQTFDSILSKYSFIKHLFRIYIAMQKILKSYLEHLCGQENVPENIPLATKTTFRIGGPAKLFVLVKSKEVLLRLVSALVFIEEPYFIIGLGSNVLASDSGFDGVVIRLNFQEILNNGEFVYADAGVTTKKLCSFAKTSEFGGLEFASAIPATIGGAIYMNAGAHGQSMSDVCVCVDVLVIENNTPRIETIEATRLKLGYRTSIFHKKKNWIIVGAYFALKPSTKEEIEKKEKEYRQARINQPTEPNAGSTFKRPSQDFYVGKVVEELGLKGKSVGGAQISAKHAGFIINTGNATSGDVMALVKFIQTQVYRKHKVRLSLEYQLLGKGNK